MLSKWFCDEKTAQYISGKELLEGKIEHYIESEEKQHYTLPNILESAKDKAVVNAEEYWVRLLLFDCLIANQDRHHENWGVITVKDKCRFSPVFDNGVGLGFRIKEEAFASFDHETHFSRYRHKIQLDKSKKPYVKDIVQYAKQRNFPLLKFINTLDIIKLENDIVISQTQMNPQIEPDYRLSNERMQFIIQFVEHRKDALCRLWKAI